MQINHPQSALITRLIQAALHAVNPELAVQRHMQRQGSQLTIAGKTYDLDDYQRIWLVAIGKAGIPMARAASAILQETICGGMVITKEGYIDPAKRQLAANLLVVETGHPIPDTRGVQASGSLMALLQNTTQGDLIICLISGGGSALLPAPAPGVSLEELQALTTSLLACGAVVNEINTLRKHLEQLKGGQLARLAQPANLAVLILSDVIGSPLDVIASGPTVPDPSTYQDSVNILDRYHLLGATPASILQRLEQGCRGEIADTPKPGDPLFDHVQNTVIGSNSQAAAAALRQAHHDGLNAMLLSTYIEGEARQVGKMLAAIARQIDENGQPLARPACVIAGGETTVTLAGKGKGGRNQELALGAVAGLRDLPGAVLVTLATDGGDGPTDAAGAIVTGDTMRRALRAGLDPEEYLADNNAYSFFQQMGDLLITGPTQTNVNDLAFLLLF